MLSAEAVILFIIAYILIMAEEKVLISKSAVALVLGTALWVLIAIRDHAKVVPHLSETSAGIFEIIIFILAAITLVQILTHYRLFDWLRYRIARYPLNAKGQLWLMSAMAFLLSAVINNITVAIVFTQLMRLFFKGKNLLIAASAVIIAANAGGAFSPIGDVTTTMLWLNNKFSSAEIIQFALAPSIVIYLISTALLVMQLKKGQVEPPAEQDFQFLRSEKLVIGFAFGSFALPFIVNLIGLNPYLGILFGLGITWIVIDILRRRLPEHRSHFTASIEHFLRDADISTLQFFVGILLAVSALDYLGILSAASNQLLGHTPSLGRLVAGSSLMGALSALVDNVPLTAAAMEIVKTTDTSIWALIALTVGAGGSILLIGSAAGIAAMGIVKELTFSSYLKVATIPALLGYAAGIGMWYLQHLTLRM
ncbi:MAG TPA: sodium:proton antiporter NhaD [Candidatus Aquicultor sp.]|jgi:Na+/H+ antiporter NhaD/arsenite permease-like protein